jgi:hypothetical protein
MQRWLKIAVTAAATTVATIAVLIVMVEMA